MRGVNFHSSTMATLKSVSQIELMNWHQLIDMRNLTPKNFPLEFFFFCLFSLIFLLLFTPQLINLFINDDRNTENVKKYRRENFQIISVKLRRLFLFKQNVFPCLRLNASLRCVENRCCWKVSQRGNEMSEREGENFLYF